MVIQFKMGGWSRVLERFASLRRLEEESKRHMQSPEGFEQIALPHLDNVYRAAVAVCRRRDEAEDLTQATFVKALERFNTLQPGTNCKAWLFQIMRNTWIDRLRHKKMAGHVVPIEEDLVATPAETAQTTWSDAEDLLENFSDEQVVDALRRLPEDQRLTLFLIDVEQLDQQEVAQITGVAVGTVKSRTSRARNELKSHLLSYAKEMGFTGRNR
jgi:RNA polymerase sigma-70 factor (ECF subfamily)